MAGGIASALADASRRGGRKLTGDFGLFEVDEFWLGQVVEEVEPRAMLLGNLFRDQLDRYGELETIADRWAAIVAGRPGLVLNADDPLVADLGRHAPEPRLLRRRRRLAGAARAPARERLQALPPLRARLHLRGRLPRPPRPLPLPQLRPEAPGPDRRGHRRRAARHPERGLHARRRAPRRAPPPRPLQRLQRARRRRADARAGHRDRATSSPACRPSSPPSAAPRRSTSTAARLASCWSRTPPAPTRCCARSRSRTASWTCSACSTTAPPTAATSAGSGTPTGSCSSAACGG